MAVVPICYKLPCKDQTLSILKGFGKNEGYFMSCVISPEVAACFPSTSKDISRRRGRCVVYNTTDCLINGKSRKWIVFSKKECAMELSSTKKQLRSLETYFGKLQKNVNQPSSNSLNNRAELLGRSRQSKAEKELPSLNDYLDKLDNGEGTFLGQAKAEKGLESLGDRLGKVNKDAKSENYVTSLSDTETMETIGHTFKQGSGNGTEKLENYMELGNRGGRESSYDKTSSLYLIDPTVGGTGPVFAIIGAWLIRQILNQDELGKVGTESMFQKAMIATALSCILSNFGPIDDWTHYGAAFSGIAYGFLTCPILQMDDTSSKTGEEGIRLVRRYVDPCKSLLFFSLFILVLGSLVFVVEPPLY